ncbi:MAG: formylglycine-generating enzyme family protein [Chitinophagales bacterium]|nr:formylglycine-generating enzyme family protein [Chitinophagales bacterium]
MQYLSPYLIRLNPEDFMTKPYYYTQSLLPQANLSFRMVHIPEGEFLMGSVEGEPDILETELPQHPVQLDSFWMAEYAVTQELWQAVMHSDPSHFKGPLRPVENVSWFDAAVFCNALSKITGRNPVYLTPGQEPYGWDGQTWKLPNEGRVNINTKADGYRLPTEAEWEYAAKGGAPKPFLYAGSDLLEQVGWYKGNCESETHDVGLLLPNAWGLYDMSGNVYEWCEDWVDKYTAERKINPRGPKESDYRVIRGGDWGDYPQYCRSARRSNHRPGRRFFNIGFRLVLQSVG